MPGVSARSAAKNMSRGARAKAAKNDRRVAAATTGEIPYTTFGKVVKALGNKMFMVQTPTKGEHLAHIRGKMARVSADDVVLLNERDYETRMGKADAVFDIVAIFESKDVRKLVKTRTIPGWMARSAEEAEADDGLDDLFDDGEESSSSSDEEDEKRDKRDKKNHRLQGKQAAPSAGGASDSDVDIDAI
jgi:translation initiation factor IF-1